MIRYTHQNVHMFENKRCENGTLAYVDSLRIVPGDKHEPVLSCIYSGIDGEYDPTVQNSTPEHEAQYDQLHPK